MQERQWKKTPVSPTSVPTTRQGLSTPWKSLSHIRNFEKDLGSIWKLIKTFNEEHKSRAKTVLNVEGELDSGKRAANLFTET
jgi:hypothetical protein